MEDGNIKKNIVIFTILCITLLTISTVNATEIMANNTASDSILYKSDSGTSHVENYDNPQTASEETVVVDDNNDAVEITNSNYKSTNSNNTNVKSIKPLKTTKNEGNKLSYSPEDSDEVTVQIIMIFMMLSMQARK